MPETAQPRYAPGASVFCDQCGHCRRHTDGRTTATDAIESVANLVEKSFPTMDITGSITHHLGAKLVEAWVLSPDWVSVERRRQLDIGTLVPVGLQQLLVPVGLQQLLAPSMR